MATRDPLDFLAGDERREHLVAVQKREQDIDDADLEWLMSYPEGRRHMWKLLDRAGLYRTSFTGDSATFFNEGARNFGLMYQDHIKRVCSEKYLQMLKEQIDDDRIRSSNTG